MRGGVCVGFEPVCPNWQKPRKWRRTTGITGLRLKSSILFMCQPCKLARLAKYPQLTQYQHKAQSIYYKEKDDAPIE